MLAGGTVAMLTCGVVQHLLDSLRGIKPPLLGWFACHHMVPCCCDPTCLFNLWSGPYTVELKHSNSLVHPNVLRRFLDTKTSLIIECTGHLSHKEGATHTLLSLRQASQWLANGVISTCVNLKTPWMSILFAAGHIRLMSLIPCHPTSKETKRCNTRQLRISQSVWWCTWALLSQSHTGS